MEASTRQAAARTFGKMMKADFAPGDPLDAILSRLRTLRIALVHDWLTGMRGGEKCLEVLCEAFPNAQLYTLIHNQGKLSPAIESMSIQTSPLQRIPGVMRHYRKLLPLMPLATRAWNVQDADLVVSFSHCVAKSVRVPQGIPHVCYCFTPMRYAWDGREGYLGTWSDRPIRRAAAGVLLDSLRRWDRQTAGRVTHFIGISETIRDRIARCYGRDSRIITPPVDVEFYNPGPSPLPREDFYLVVSALVPYKRIDQAVMACERLNRRLLVIGEGTERQRLESLAGPNTTFLGWRSNEEIRDHYRRCRALLFPGVEDFGIVPVEAIACGAPVIALGQGGGAETVDESAGRTYPEPTVESLLAELVEWERLGFPHDPVKARRRAEQFSLPAYREQMLRFLAEVAFGKGHPADSVPPSPHVPPTGVARVHRTARPNSM